MRQELPRFVEPMLATTGRTTRDSWDGFALEVKWDGCRAQARVDRAAVSLRTRHGRACTSEFPELEDGPRWRVPRYFVGDECAPVYAATRERGVEGVIAKRLGSPYSPGRRSRDWVKFKHRPGKRSA